MKTQNSNEVYPSLAWHDLQWCLRRSPRAVLEAMKRHGDKIIIAGGFIRSCVSNEPINDIDLFVPTKEFGAALALELAKGEEKKVHNTDNAFTIKGHGIPIQIIHRWTFTNAIDAVRSFDFTIARAAFWWFGDNEKGNWGSIADPRFYQDLAGKRLIYCQPKRIEEVGGSMLRVLKFYQRGYRIPLDSLGAVIARLMSGVQLSKIIERSNQEGAHSTEVQLAKVLSGLLREVDPNVDPNHISHLPSEPEFPEPNE